MPAIRHSCEMHGDQNESVRAWLSTSTRSYERISTATNSAFIAVYDPLFLTAKSQEVGERGFSSIGNAEGTVRFPQEERRELLAE